MIKKTIISLLVIGILCTSLCSCSSTPSKSSESTEPTSKVVESTVAITDSTITSNVVITEATTRKDNITETPPTVESSTSQPQTEATTNSTFSTTSVTTTPTISPQAPTPSISQVTNDLLYWECNYFVLNGVNTCLNIDSIDLVSIQDNILFSTFRYCIELADEYYKVIATYDLNYTYDYSSNVWIFSYCSLVDHKSTATKSQIDQNRVIQTCERRFDSYKIIEHQYWTDDSGVFTDVITFQGVLSSKYFTEVYDCTYTYKFENDYWHESWNITPQLIDWSLVEGTWTLTHYDEFITINILDVTQTTNDKIDIVYSYETSPWYDDGPWDGYFDSDCDGSSRSEAKLQRTCELDIYSSEFVGSTKYGHLDTYAFVLPIQIGGWEVECEEGFFSLCFDINKGFCIHNFKYLYKNPNHSTPSYDNNYWYSDANEETVYFKQVIDYDKLQEAIDKLKDMNS